MRLCIIVLLLLIIALFYYYYYYDLDLFLLRFNSCKLEIKDKTKDQSEVFYYFIIHSRPLGLTF